MEILTNTCVIHFLIVLAIWSERRREGERERERPV